MFDSKRNVRIMLAGLTLVLLVAAWTAVTMAATPTETPAASAATVAATLPTVAVTATAPAGIPTIPHPVAGHEKCLTCHVEAQPAGNAPTVAATTPTTATTTSGVPAIPHAVAGHENCTTCHVEAAPAGGATPGAAAPAVPHEIAGREKCNTCHAVGTGVKPSPADHQGRTEDTCLYCHTSASGEKVTLPPLPKEASTEFCLSCHGPFDALAARSVDKLEVNGVKANPHRYVPHDSKNITGCDACHSVHELPVTATTQIPIPKPEELSCFSSSCHHQQDFTPCAQCHKD